MATQLPAQANLSAPAGAALVLGLDRLSELAGALGPGSAAELLERTAARLRRSLAPGFALTPLPDGRLAVTCAQARPEAALLAFARALARLASAPLVLAGEELRLSASVGVARSSGGGAPAERLVGDASAAQHRAARDGGGRVELFVAADRGELIDALRLESELRASLASGSGLVLFYQPIVSLHADTVLAVEALLRWEHPDRGLLLAGRFLGLAQRCGLMGAIERWVIDTACAQLSSWQRGGRAAAPRRVAINLSAAALEDPALVETIAGSLRHWSLRGEQLIVELEGDSPSGGAALDALRALGVAVYRADSVTGPLDGIKLTRRSVGELCDGRDRARVIEAQLDVARERGLAIIAEGVEATEQLERLRALGCAGAQGLCFLGPVPAATLIEVLSLSWREPTVEASRASDEERAITMGQATELLGISASTLRRWSDDGRVASLRTSGGHRRYRVSDLRRLGSAPPPRLRLPALPDAPVPAVAELLRAEGVELARTAASSLYDGAGGWFAREQALAPIGGWISSLADALAHGGYERLIDAMRALMLSAEIGGASLAERHAFLERFAAALTRRLGQQQRGQREQTLASRTLAALAVTLLSDVGERGIAALPARQRLRRPAHVAHSPQR